jgi:hypothetical protein
MADGDDIAASVGITARPGAMPGLDFRGGSAFESRPQRALPMNMALPA